MNGKELIYEALRHHETPRTPWLPFVGVHGGQLLGVSATEYLTNSDLIYKGLKRAYDLYSPDALPIVFDLQVEAEVLGCELMWAQEDPPSVVGNPLATGTMADLPEFSTDKGRFPVIREAITRLSEDIGDHVALYGLITGPFTLAMHLKSQMMFLELYDNPEAAREVLNYTASVACETARFYARNGADVVAVVDPMISQIGESHFTELVAPAADQVFDCIHNEGAFGSFFVCGDATDNLEAMAKTRCDNISVDENISLEYLREISKMHRKSVGGNMKLTTALLLGDTNDAKREALRCLDTMDNTTGFILSPGCDLPWGVPEENLQAVKEIVQDDYQREVARQTISALEEDTFEDIELPDYSSLDHVLVEVFTLDSAACPPCTYMVNAAEEAAQASGGVQVREHKIKGRDGIGRMTRLGVEHIPTICIDGEPVFVSTIPAQPRLQKAFQQAKAEKGLS